MAGNNGVRELEGLNGGNIYHANRGLFYHKDRTDEDSGTIYYKCVRYRTYRCRGRAIWTPSEEGGHFFESTRHNHLPDPLLVGRLLCRRAILARCRSGEATPFRTILREERARFPRAVAAQVTMRRMRSAMNRARLSLHPPIPQSLQELGEVLQNPAYRLLTMTEDGEASVFSCYVVATDGTVSVIFTSARQVELMGRAAILFADGTFCTPSVPEASQVFNICTTWRWHILPLAVVLMERRTIPAYRSVIQKLKNLCPNLSPDTIMSDYESGQIRVWREEFPNADWEGCLFHFMADLIENAKSFGLAVMMRANPTVSQIIRFCCVIPMAPPQLMREAYDCIERQARATTYFDFLEDFFTYVLNTWLRSVRALHLSVCGSENRTNNVSESFNRTLQDELQSSHHPNIWRFINTIIKIEDNMVTDLSTLYNGDTPSRDRPSAALANDAAISAWTDDLLRGLINIEEFITHVSLRVTNAFNDLVG